MSFLIAAGALASIYPMVTVVLPRNWHYANPSDRIIRQLQETRSFADLHGDFVIFVSDIKADRLIEFQMKSRWKDGRHSEVKAKEASIQWNDWTQVVEITLFDFDMRSNNGEDRLR